jgi:hypothetical protein
LGRFIRLAVSPEPERRSRAAAPQGKQRVQVEQGSKRELLAETNGPNITSELSIFARTLLSAPQQ